MQFGFIKGIRVDFKKLATRIQSYKSWILEHVFRPMISRLLAYFSNKANSLDPSEKIIDPESKPIKTEWKQKALSDFKAWLIDLPESFPDAENIKMDSCDLYTLLSEFVSLRHEIKAQNKTQQEVLQVQKALIDSHNKVTTLFETKTLQLDKLEENIRSTSERRAVEPFLDARDALCRGLVSAQKAATDRSFFHRPPKNINEVIGGYETALRRFDRALSYVGILPVETVGKPFDSRTMQMIDQRFDPNSVPGTVLDDLLCGFTRGVEVIRRAHVLVSTSEKP
jgi:molecular chaperone GrpE